MNERLRTVVVGAVVAVFFVAAVVALLLPAGEPEVVKAPVVTRPVPVSNGAPAMAEPAAATPIVAGDRMPAGRAVSAALVRTAHLPRGGGRLTVHVVYEDGNAAAGAVVTATLRPDDLRFDGKPALPNYAAQTDDEGYAVLENVAVGAYALHGTDGELHGTVNSGIVGSRAEEAAIVLDGRGRIAGVVLTEDGTPVAQARVIPIFSDERRARMMPLDSHGVETNEAGAFSVVGLPAMAVRLVASAEGYAPEITDAITPDRDDVSMVLTAGGALIGTAKQQGTGEPVAGVPLTFTLETPPYLPLVATTGSDGEFALGAVAPGTYRCSIDSGPYRLAGIVGRITVGNDRQRIDVEVVAGGVVVGAVLRGVAKTPVAGVSVTAGESSGTAGPSSSRRTATPTGGDGVFRIAGLAPGEYNLYAEGEAVGGSVRPVQVHLADGQRIDGIEIVLPETRVVRGTVTTAGGAPAPGAVVYGSGIRPLDVHGTADENGAFVLTGVPLDEEISVYASLREMRSRVEGPLAFSDAGEAEAALVLEDVGYGSVAGRVMGDDRTGVAHATVLLMAEGDFGAFQYAARSDEQGEVRFDRVVAGDYGAVAIADGYQPLEEDRTIAVARGQQVTGVVWALSNDGVDVAGTVVDGDGKPVVGIDVVAMGMNRWAAVTGGDGAFLLKGVYGRTFRCVASHPDLGTATYSGPIQSDITLTLGAGELVRGKVVDAASGAPVSRFAIGATRANPGDPREWTEQPRLVVDDPHGAFALDLGAFPRGVIVVADGYAPKVTPAVPGTEVLVLLDRGRRIAGRVVDTSGAPVAGAAIYVGPIPDRRFGAPTSEIRSDADGRFVVENVVDGAMLLTADREGYAHGSVQIPRDRDVADARIELSQGGVLRLTLDTAGWPEGDAYVRIATGLDSESTPAIPRDEPALFANVPPGRHSVHVMWRESRGPGTAGRRWQIERDVVIATGQTTELALALPRLDAALEGVVTDGGRPVAGARVLVVIPAQGGGILTVAQVESGPDGRFAVDALASGDYAVYVPGNGDASYPAALVPNQTTRVDIDISAGQKRTPLVQ